MTSHDSFFVTLLMIGFLLVVSGDSNEEQQNKQGSHLTYIQSESTTSRKSTKISETFSTQTAIVENGGISEKFPSLVSEKTTSDTDAFAIFSTLSEDGIETTHIDVPSLAFDKKNDHNGSKLEILPLSNRLSTVAAIHDIENKRTKISETTQISSASTSSFAPTKVSDRKTENNNRITTIPSSKASYYTTNILFESTTFPDDSDTPQNRVEGNSTALLSEIAAGNKDNQEKPLNNFISRFPSFPSVDHSNTENLASVPSTKTNFEAISSSPLGIVTITDRPSTLSTEIEAKMSSETVYVENFTLPPSDTIINTKEIAKHTASIPSKHTNTRISDKIFIFSADTETDTTLKDVSSILSVSSSAVDISENMQKSDNISIATIEIAFNTTSQTQAPIIKTYSNMSSSIVVEDETLPENLSSTIQQTSSSLSTISEVLPSSQSNAVFNLNKELNMQSNESEEADVLVNAENQTLVSVEPAHTLEQTTNDFINTENKNGISFMETTQSDELYNSTDHTKFSVDSFQLHTANVLPDNLYVSSSQNDSTSFATDINYDSNFSTIIAPSNVPFSSSSVDRMTNDPETATLFTRVESKGSALVQLNPAENQTINVFTTVGDESSTSFSAPMPSAHSTDTLTSHSKETDVKVKTNLTADILSQSTTQDDSNISLTTELVHSSSKFATPIIYVKDDFNAANETNEPQKAASLVKNKNKTVASIDTAEEITLNIKGMYAITNVTDTTQVYTDIATFPKFSLNKEMITLSTPVSFINDNSEQSATDNINSLNRSTELYSATQGTAITSDTEITLPTVLKETIVIGNGAENPSSETVSSTTIYSLLTNNSDISVSTLPKITTEQVTNRFINSIDDKITYSSIQKDYASLSNVPEKTSSSIITESLVTDSTSIDENLNDQSKTTKQTVTTNIFSDNRDETPVSDLEPNYAIPSNRVVLKTDPPLTADEESNSVFASLYVNLDGLFETAVVQRNNSKFSSDSENDENNSRVSSSSEKPETTSVFNASNADNDRTSAVTMSHLVATKFPQQAGNILFGSKTNASTTVAQEISSTIGIVLNTSINVIEVQKDDESIITLSTPEDTSESDIYDTNSTGAFILTTETNNPFTNIAENTETTMSTDDINIGLFSTETTVEHSTEVTSDTAGEQAETSVHHLTTFTTLSQTVSASDVSKFETDNQSITTIEIPETTSANNVAENNSSGTFMLTTEESNSLPHVTESIETTWSMDDIGVGQFSNATTKHSSDIVSNTELATDASVQYATTKFTTSSQTVSTRATTTTEMITPEEIEEYDMITPNRPTEPPFIPKEILELACRSNLNCIFAPVATVEVVSRPSACGVRCSAHSLIRRRFEYTIEIRGCQVSSLSSDRLKNLCRRKHVLLCGLSRISILPNYENCQLKCQCGCGTYNVEIPLPDCQKTTQ